MTRLTEAQEVVVACRERALLKQRLKAERRTRAVELAAQGLTTSEIANRLGVQRDYVRKLLLGAGIRVRRAPGARDLPHGLP